VLLGVLLESDLLQQEACRVQRNHIDTADKTVVEQHRHLAEAAERQHELAAREWLSDISMCLVEYH